MMLEWSDMQTDAYRKTRTRMLKRKAVSHQLEERGFWAKVPIVSRCATHDHALEGFPEERHQSAEWR